MKRFIIQIIALFTIVALVDFTSGKIFGYIRAHAKGGATYRDKYICDEVESDILMVGSSRCEHHYNPILFEDEIKKVVIMQDNQVMELLSHTQDI